MPSWMIIIAATLTSTGSDSGDGASDGGGSDSSGGDVATAVEVTVVIETMTCWGNASDSCTGGFLNRRRPPAVFLPVAVAGELFRLGELGEQMKSMAVILSIISCVPVILVGPAWRALNESFRFGREGTIPAQAAIIFAGLFLAGNALTLAMIEQKRRSKPIRWTSLVGWCLLQVLFYGFHFTLVAPAAMQNILSNQRD